MGSTHSRFASFVRGPGAIPRLRGDWSGLGHNPLGALSVLGLIGVVGLQTAGGLFGNDDIAFRARSTTSFPRETSDWITGLHRKGLLARRPAGGPPIWRRSRSTRAGEEGIARGADAHRPEGSRPHERDSGAHRWRPVALIFALAVDAPRRARSPVASGSHLRRQHQRPRQPGDGCKGAARKLPLLLSG